MKRKIFFIIGAIILVLVVVAGGFWYMSTQPLYKPGMVRQKWEHRSRLPPNQRDSRTWLVEPNIELAHFAVGEGRNVLDHPRRTGHALPPAHERTRIADK